MLKRQNPLGKFKSSRPFISTDSVHRRRSSRRTSIDIKFMGLGKYMDRRKGVRRKADRFDKEGYERLCRQRLGPGWL